MRVAPFTGARVETPAYLMPTDEKGVSLPSRERELKLREMPTTEKSRFVAPFTGARVETIAGKRESLNDDSRSLHGSAS